MIGKGRREIWYCTFCWYLKKMWFNVVEFSNGFIEVFIKNCWWNFRNVIFGQKSELRWNECRIEMFVFPGRLGKVESLWSRRETTVTLNCNLNPQTLCQATKEDTVFHSFIFNINMYISYIKILENDRSHCGTFLTICMYFNGN